MHDQRIEYVCVSTFEQTRPVRSIWAKVKHREIHELISESAARL